MKPIKDVSKLILNVLNEKREGMDTEYLAYVTGSTTTKVIEEGKKLQKLGMVELMGSKIKLTMPEGSKFNKWDQLKK